MALPTPSNNWEFQVNQTLGTYGTITLQAQGILFAIKNSLTAFSTEPWVVVSSSDSVTAGLGDKWLTSANLIWSSTTGTGNRSWVVLQRSDGFSICFHCGGNFPSVPQAYLNIVVSPTGQFAGGSVTARPTAADEHIVLDGTGVTGAAYWMAPTTIVEPTNRFILHVQTSENANATRWFLFKNSRLMHFFTCGQALNTPSFVHYWGGCWPNVEGGNDNNLKATYATWNDMARMAIWHDGTTYAGTPASGTGLGVAYLATEQSTTSMVGEQLSAANEISGNWWIGPQRMMSLTAGIRGTLGQTQDQWWTQSSGLANGDTFPSTGTHEFVVFNHMVFPWNGTAPLVV